MAANTYMDDYAGRLCDRFESSLVALAGLDNQGSRDLGKELEAPPEAGGIYTRRSVSQTVAAQTGSVAGLGVDVVDLLVDIVVTSRASRNPLASLVDETSAELRRIHPDIDSTQLAQALVSLARTQAVAFLAVGEDLLAENAAVYIDSRIVRDFRPMYEEDMTGEPIGISRYLSQQRLRIRYWSEGHERVFEVTLRDDDLSDLERWLFRAKSKLPLVPEVEPRSTPTDNSH